MATRAGCGKATIYRRWRSRAALLLDTANHIGPQAPAVDTGTARGDLVEMLTSLGAKMRDTASGRILPGVIAEASVRPEMREVLATFVDDRRATPLAMVDRAVERGELPPETDAESLLDVLAGTVIYRELVAYRPTDEAWVSALVDRVLPGFGWTGGPRRP